MVEYKSDLLNDAETDKVTLFLADERKRVNALLFELNPLKIWRML